MKQKNMLSKYQLTNVKIQNKKKVLNAEFSLRSYE